MYQVSDKTNEYLLGNNRMFQARISAGDKEIISGFISIKQYQQSNGSNYISIGDAVSSNVEIKLWKPEEDIDFENTEFELSIAPIVDGEPDFIPLGLFTALNPSENNGILTIIAYDRLYSKMSGTYYSKLEYPVDGKEVIKEISELTGVPVDVSNLPDGIVINKKESNVEMSTDDNGNIITAVKYENPYDGYSYKDAISFLAQFYCKFVTVNRNGTVVFRWYDPENIVYELSEDRYYDDLSVNENIFTIKSITCVVGDKTLGSGLGFSSIQIENPVMTQDDLNRIYEQVKTLSFYPFSTSFFGDIRIDLGDSVRVIQKNGTELFVPVMEISHDFDGGIITNIASYGRTEQEENSNGPTYIKLAQLESEIAVVKEIVGDKADFREIVAQMITVNKVLFGNMTILDFYNQVIQNNTSISETINGLLIDVSSLSNKKEISDNSSIQTYDVVEVPTLNNYPTITDFFILDVCSDNLYCSEELICGTNNYDAHLGEIAFNQLNGNYYVFEKNTDGLYGWRQMSQAEVALLADKYASVNVSEGSITMTAGYEDEQCDVKITHEGLRATVLYCC